MRVFQNTPFPRRGGPPAVDLVNTEVVVRGQPGDLLADDETVAAWFEFERERLELSVDAGRPSLEEVHRLRAALRRTFTAIVGGDPPPREPLEEINAAAGREPVGIALEWEEAPCVRTRGGDGELPTDGLAAVGRSAVTFLAGPDRARLRKCGNPRCVLFFLASNRRQHWCSEACGRRVRIARHERLHGRRPAR